MDTVLLNADKNNKMFQLDHQNSKNLKFISTNTLNRPESTEKNPQSNISSRQPLQLPILLTDHNPLILITFAEDNQIDNLQKTIQKTDIVDQIVKTITRKKQLL